MSNTRNASDTTWLRKVRTFYADRVIQQALFDNGVKNHIVFESNGSQKILSYIPVYGSESGELNTTPEERATYLRSVPNVPYAPTNVIATGGDTTASVAFDAGFDGL